MSAKKSKDGEEFSGYSEFYLADETYGEKEALEKLRTALRRFKGIHAGFLNRIGEEDAFCVEKRYIPVYRLKAQAEYVWQKSGRKKSASAQHREKREVECIRLRAPEELNAGEWKTPRPLQSAELPAPFFADSAIPFKENERELKRTAEAYSPDKKASVSLNEVHLEVVLVPVLTCACRYGEEEYTGVVNMHNGAVTAEYPVSQRVETEVDKFLSKVRTAKQCIAFAALFLFVFAVLALVKLLREDGGVSVAAVAGLFALLTVPLCAFLKCLTYRREKLFQKAGDSGRASGAPFVLTITLLSWAACAFGIFLFAVKVLF